MPRRLEIALLLGLIAAACGPASTGQEPDVALEDTADVAGPGSDFVEFELFDTTRTLPPDTVDLYLLSVTDGEVRVAAEVPWAEMVTADDVLLVAPHPLAPRGFVRRVTSRSDEAGALVLTTETAHPSLAFKHLAARVRGSVELGAPRADKADDPALERAELALGTGPIAVDFFAFNGDDDPDTPEDQVRVQGTFEGTIGYQLEIGIDWPSFTTWPPDVLPDLEASLDVTLGATADLSMAGMASKAFSRKETLDEIPILPPIVIWPLTFNPAISLDVEIEGSAAGAYDVSTGVGATVTVGASLDSDGDAGFDPPSTSVTYETPQVAASWYAKGRVSAGPTLHIRLYDSLGPYAGLRAFADLSADVADAPCWRLGGGLEGVIGFDMRVAGLELADWSKSFDIAEKELDTGACAEHPVLDGATDIVPPDFEPWSAVIQDVSSSASGDDSRVSLVTTVDGHSLVVGSESAAPFKLTRSGDVLWAWELAGAGGGGVPARAAAACEGLDGVLHLALDKPAGLARILPDGALQASWTPETAVQAPAPFAAVHCLDDGSVILAGTVADAAPGDVDLWLTRLDASGAPLWSRRWGLPDRDEEPTALVPLDGDLVVLVRAFRVTDEPAARSALLRVTTAGDMVWQQEAAGCDLFAGLTLRTGLRSGDGDLVVAGQLEGGANAAVTMKFKPDGALAWANAADGDFLGLDTTALIQLTDGGFLAAGTWWRADQDDLWLGRTDSVGRFYWLRRYDSGVADVAPALSLTGEGGVLMVGYTKQGESGHSVWASRLPVEDGTLALAAGSGAVSEAGDWVNYDEPCLEANSGDISLADHPVAWVAAELSVTPISPAVTVLSP